MSSTLISVILPGLATTLAVFTRVVAIRTMKSAPMIANEAMTHGWQYGTWQLNVPNNREQSQH